MDNIRAVHAVLSQVTPSETLESWELTPNKLQTAATSFGKNKRAPVTSWANMDQLVGDYLTPGDRAKIQEMRPWIGGFMRPDDFPGTHSLGLWRRTRGAALDLNVPEISAWVNDCDISLLDTDPHTKSMPDIPPPDFTRNPALRMMYRTFDMDRGWKTKHVTGDVYAVLCQLEWKNQVATSGSVLQTKEGVALRASFIDFLSSICTQRGDNFVGTPAARRKTKTPIRWSNWDDGLVDEMVAQSSAQFGVLDLSLSPAERAGVVGRQRVYSKELAQLAKWLESSMITRCAPYAAGDLEYNVAKAYDQLVLVGAR